MEHAGLPAAGCSHMFVSTQAAIQALDEPKRRRASTTPLAATDTWRCFTEASAALQSQASLGSQFPL
jgi:hypothetical protein